ncbi:GNAT family N-acetyltransferase [Nocardioides pinisoli]|uniref:GNAT family N-acetyltransferase n=1 Tax=Nocardioides pinisoli TaxID=2950279 RepID=A0ABT1KVR7_9ACTN|nr:GNAT family N-acetyltransferase [Nocardioides pinisoli]MCP3421346.1 GNAT family N-acetyltransferase [Nocardioides pinisoli]
MPVTVRRAREADAEGLSRLAALTFPLACTPQTPADVLAAHIAASLDPASFRHHVADPACTVLVAEAGEGGDPVGYTMLRVGEPDDPDVARAIRQRPTVELVRFYVHPGHHGTGTAGLLMEHTLVAAHATEARGAWLGVSEENARANAFYARHGFEPVGRKRFLIGDRWEDDVVRERVLSSAPGARP